MTMPCKIQQCAILGINKIIVADIMPQLLEYSECLNYYHIKLCNTINTIAHHYIAHLLAQQLYIKYTLKYYLNENEISSFQKGLGPVATEVFCILSPRVTSINGQTFSYRYAKQVTYIMQTHFTFCVNHNAMHWYHYQ